MLTSNIKTFRDQCITKYFHVRTDQIDQIDRDLDHLNPNLLL